MKAFSFKNFSKKFIAVFFVLQIMFPGWAVTLADEISEATLPYKEGEILVKYKDGYVDMQSSFEVSLLKNSQNSGVEIIETIPGENLAVVRYESSFVESIFENISGVSEEEKMKKWIEMYENNPNVEMAQPNFIYKTSATPNDEHYARQWYLKNTGAYITGLNQLFEDAATEHGLTGLLKEWFFRLRGVTENGIIATEGVDIGYERANEIYKTARNRLGDAEKNKKIIIAVADSGVDYNHPELKGKMWNGEKCKDYRGEALGGCIHGYDLVDDDKDPMKGTNLHGTQVASIIASTSHNSLGMAGVAPDVEIMALRTSGDDGVSTTLSMAKAIAFAEANGAIIFNSSNNTDPVDISRFDKVDSLLYNVFKLYGGIIVNSAGNDGVHTNNTTNVVLPSVFSMGFEDADGELYPALDNMIIVGAHTPRDTMAIFSNYGNGVHISAPGSEILAIGNAGRNTELSGTDYDLIDGTSFSAPMVAGMIGMMKSAYPEKSLSEIKTIILETGVASDEYLGKTISGKRANLANAMQKLEEDYISVLPLSGTISPATTAWTKDSVLLTLTTNQDIITPDGWTMITPQKFQKNFVENTEISVQIKTADSRKSAVVSYSLKNIDKTAPVVSITAPQNNFETTQDKISLVFSATDAGSGVNKIFCSESQNNNFTECTSPKEFNLKAGENIIEIMAVDALENRSEKARIRIVKTDSTSQTNPTSHTPPTPPRPVWSAPSAPAPQSSSGGPGGYYEVKKDIPLTAEVVQNEEKIILSSSENSQNEENILLTSADNSLQNPKFIVNVASEDIFEYSATKTHYSAYEIEKILEKEWIRESDNSDLRRFSVSDKMIFLDKMVSLGNIENNFLLANPDDNTKTFLDFVKKIQQIFIENWEKWKFFILHP